MSLVAHQIPAAAAPLKATLPAFAAAIFLSAFLLFGVQPMFTKMVLPVLGGAPSVWSIAMVVFQALLLAGYAYAHLLTSRLTLRRALQVHIVVMTVAALALPITLTQTMGDPPTDGQALWLIGVFLVSIGAPFFAVSANGPLLQAWFARSGHPHAADPYFLYGASNIGSFAALIAYPILVEPLLGLRDQALGWTIGYGLLMLAIAVSGLLAIALSGATPREDAAAHAEDAPAPTAREKVVWTALAFVPSALLVAVTAHISADIAAAPFLWVVPLALFLATFVITFQKRPVLPHGVMLAVQPAAVGALVLLAYTGLQAPVLALLALNLVAFFVSAMVAHGELVARRPAAKHLTGFYLFMSLGGVLGGVFAALLAPALFSTVLEYPILLVASLMVRVPAWTRAPKLITRDLAIGLAVGVALALPRFAFTGEWRVPFVLAGICALFAIVVLWHRHALRVAAVVAALFAADHATIAIRGEVDAVRSFFGVHKVSTSADGDYRVLSHGTTIHGAMRIRDAAGAPVATPTPTTYYHPDGPFADAIRAVQATRANARVAAVGLGTGSVAWYARPGEVWTFYEIDRDVATIARDPARFSFMTRVPDAPIVIGDARLTLRDVPDGSLDLLLIDAFASDAIPVHLLTVEAIRLYASKLKPDGVVLFHVSNRNMELGSVLSAGAARLGLSGMKRFDVFKADLSEGQFRASTDVVVLARDPAALTRLQAKAGWQPLPASATQAWTDDYANVPAALWRRLVMRQ